MKYINPFTDFGFKRIFGLEQNKDILLDFLNEMMKDFDIFIQDLTYKNVEQHGVNEEDRKIIFDLYCVNDKGDYFTIELQKAKQNHFKDRLIYYSARTIQEQGIKGKWNYELKAVYVIAIMDFVLEEKKVKVCSQLLDIETNEVFYDKLAFVNLYVKNFNKDEHELETNFDKWLFVLKNLSKMEHIPSRLQNLIFNKVFQIAEYTKLSREEQNAYDESLKNYNDLNNSLNTAKADGYLDAQNVYLPLLEKAKKKEQEAKKKEQEAKKKEQETNVILIKMINKMLEKGFSLEEIAIDLDKSVDDIQRILK